VIAGWDIYAVLEAGLTLILIIHRLQPVAAVCVLLSDQRPLAEALCAAAASAYLSDPAYYAGSWILSVRRRLTREHGDASARNPLRSRRRAHRSRPGRRHSSGKAIAT